MGEAKRKRTAFLKSWGWQMALVKMAKEDMQYDKFRQLVRAGVIRREGQNADLRISV